MFPDHLKNSPLVYISTPGSHNETIGRRKSHTVIHAPALMYRRHTTRITQMHSDYFGMRITQIFYSLARDILMANSMKTVHLDPQIPIHKIGNSIPSGHLGNRPMKTGIKNCHMSGRRKNLSSHLYTHQVGWIVQGSQTCKLTNLLLYIIINVYGL